MRNWGLEAKKRRLKTFLLGLSRTEQLVVVMYYYDNIPIWEIAPLLEVSESGVLQMLSSVIRRGRSHVKKQGRW